MNEEHKKDQIILFVDDEEKSRKYFLRLFGHEFDVLLAKDGVEALEIFQEHMDEIAVVISDQKMPNMTGSQFLAKVAELKPLTVRILSTAYSNLDAAVDSVNEGGIYRYITKPWEVSDLEVTLKKAVEHYSLQKEHAGMLKQKFSSVEMLASSDRVLTAASLAVFLNGDLRRVGNALQTLVHLAEVGGDEVDVSERIDESLTWRELYRRHLLFLQSMKGRFTLETLKAENLDYEKTVPVHDVLDGLVGDDSYFEWGRGASSLTEWPGSMESMRKEISLLLNAIESIMKDAGILLVSETQGGIELRISSRLLAKNLEAFRSTTKDAPPENCFDLAVALLRLSHAGAIFGIVPEENKGMIRFSIKFDLTQNIESASTGWNSLDEALAGNDMFWSQFGV